VLGTPHKKNPPLKKQKNLLFENSNRCPKNKGKNTVVGIPKSVCLPKNNDLNIGGHHGCRKNGSLVGRGARVRGTTPPYDINETCLLKKGRFKLRGLSRDAGLQMGRSWEKERPIPDEFCLLVGKMETMLTNEQKKMPGTVTDPGPPPRGGGKNQKENLTRTAYMRGSGRM